MSIDQLELILYDMYHMDAWMPPLFGKWTEEFKKSSYSNGLSTSSEILSPKEYIRGHRDQLMNERRCEACREVTLRQSK